MKALKFSILTLFVLPHSPAQADWTAPTKRVIVEPGIEYLFYEDAPTPMHVVVIDRSHREYEFKVLANPSSNTGLFWGQHVEQLAKTPQAIIAINGGRWDCPTLPRIPGPRELLACKGFIAGGLMSPTGVFAADGIKLHDAVDREVIFGAAQDRNVANQIAILSSLAWTSSSHPYRDHAIGIPPSDYNRDRFVMRAGICQPAYQIHEPRSAIGYGPDHIVMLSSDHRSDAHQPDIPDLCWFFNRHGVTDAMVLDGGHSAQLYVQGQDAPVNPLRFLGLKNARYVANAIGIVKVCNTAGEACSGDSECCNGTTCQSGRCATPPPSTVCGNGVCEAGESCDGGDLNGNTCSALGFDDGTLRCSSACTFNTSLCCNDQCTSGTMCVGDVLQTCGNYDSDPCLEWGGGMTCAYGCSGGVCQAPGPTCSVVMTQGFEDPNLFSDNVIGPQPFISGGQQIGEFWDAWTSRIRHGTGHSPSTWGLNLEEQSSGGYSNTFVSFVAPTASTETLRVSFYAYNPLPTSYNIGLQRAGGPLVTRTVPPQNWTLISADLSSSFSTTDAIIYLGLLPTSQGSFTFKMDDVVIERCTQ